MRSFYGGRVSIEHVTFGGRFFGGLYTWVMEGAPGGFVPLFIERLGL